jgi:hypothetical protein
MLINGTSPNGTLPLLNLNETLSTDIKTTVVEMHVDKNSGITTTLIETTESPLPIEVPRRSDRIARRYARMPNPNRK